jgi:hypothetical protein
MQDERFQGRRSIKKGNNRYDTYINITRLKCKTKTYLTTGQQGKPLDIASDKWKLRTTIRENSRRIPRCQIYILKLGRISDTDLEWTPIIVKR